MRFQYGTYRNAWLMRASGRIVLALVLGFMLKGHVRGQNLVPNPSFEVYDTCPTYQNQVHYATGWFNPWASSSDYFNACASDSLYPSPYFSTPFNEFGFQWPADGEAYVGISTGNGLLNTPYREAVAVQLLDPLQPGALVYMAFKASPGGFGSWEVNSAHWTGKGVGLKFFVTVPMDLNTYLYPNSAAVHLDQALTDTANWTTVSGTYVPDSAYQYVVVANFFADSLSQPQVMDPDGDFPKSYAFIDQVCVSYSPDYCDQWLGLSSSMEQPDLKISPNPFTEHLTLDGPVHPQVLELSMTDVLGRRVWQGFWPAGQRYCTISVPHLPAGSYFMRVADPYGAVRSFPVVHVVP